MSNNEALKLIPLVDEVEFTNPNPEQNNIRGLVLGIKSSEWGVIVNVLFEDEDEYVSRTWNCSYLKKI